MDETQRLRTALLASLGHDLRTPLASIQGAAGTLGSMGDQLDPATRADLLSSIEEDVGRMAHFLASITELTRLESGEIRPNLMPVPVLDAVEAAIARLAGAPLVAVHVDPGLCVLADPALLEQALHNVLDNAVKYAPPGSLVRVSADRGVEIQVADEGVGIPADDLARVFDSFFRATRGDRVAPGTGLGLAIARGLIEAMGGRITARSPRPDAARDGLPGTVISIHLQACPA
jgi:two-component system, OmpR family, sensor histidine kinase KdpD